MELNLHRAKLGLRPLLYVKCEICSSGEHLTRDYRKSYCKLCL